MIHQEIFSAHIPYGKGKFSTQLAFFPKFAMYQIYTQLKGIIHRIRVV